MTSAGNCHKCQIICHAFHYTEPYVSGQGHKGYWHCKEHGPQYVKEELAQPGSSDTSPTAHLNRAERRKLAKRLNS